MCVELVGPCPCDDAWSSPVSGGSPGGPGEARVRSQRRRVEAEFRAEVSRKRAEVLSG